MCVCARRLLPPQIAKPLSAQAWGLANLPRWFTRPGIYSSLNVSDTLGIPFNPNAARDYIRQAGYDKKKLPNITLAVNSNDTHQRIAETIAQMWKTNLGVEVRVSPLDWDSYIQTVRDDPPQIFRLGWCGYYSDAANFAGTVFSSSSPENHTRWKSPQFDQIIDSAARRNRCRQEA